MSSQQPELGAPMAACHECSSTIELLRLRRSTPADFLTGPGPDTPALEVMLQIAARVPDHRRVVPFRFVIFAGEARARFGAVLRERFVDNEPGASEERAAHEQNRFLRAPIVVAVISAVNKEHRTPEWEQLLCAGAACQNLLLAASAHGFAAQWLTEWCAYDEGVKGALGLDRDERVAGYIYIGTAIKDPKERARPDMASIVSRY